MVCREDGGEPVVRASPAGADPPQAPRPARRDGDQLRATLAPADAEQALQATKDPYIFDFLELADDARERELEQALIDDVQRFLLELGSGFAFYGRQTALSTAEVVEVEEVALRCWKDPCRVQARRDRSECSKRPPRPRHLSPADLGLGQARPRRRPKRFAVRSPRPLGGPGRDAQAPAIPRAGVPSRRRRSGATRTTATARRRWPRVRRA